MYSLKFDIQEKKEIHNKKKKKRLSNPTEKELV